MLFYSFQHFLTYLNLSNISSSYVSFKIFAETSHRYSLDSEISNLCINLFEKILLAAQSQFF